MKKKIATMILCFIFAFALAGCGMNNSYEIKITVPAGSTERFAFSEEEISPLGKTITVYASDGLSDTEIVLKPIEVHEENVYEPTYITRGMPVKMDVEKGAWFKIGVNMQNDTDSDKTVYVEIEGVDVRVQ